MIRPILTELVVAIAPFALYALWMMGHGQDPRRSLSWRDAPWIGLLSGVVVLTLASLALYRAFDTAPAGSHYTPAHLENGRVVPPTLQ